MGRCSRPGRLASIQEVLEASKLFQTWLTWWWLRVWQTHPGAVRPRKPACLQFFSVVLAVGDQDAWCAAVAFCPFAVLVVEEQPSPQEQDSCSAVPDELLEHFRFGSGEDQCGAASVVGEFFQPFRRATVGRIEPYSSEPRLFESVFMIAHCRAWPGL